MRFSPVPARRPNKEAAQIGPWGGLVCAVSLRFGGVGTRAQDCGLWPHADKTGGFQRGAAAPPWHTTLLARCSVLYLLAWLTGEAGGGAVCAPLPPSGKRAGFRDREGTKSPFVFRERRQVYKPPSFVPRRAGTKCPIATGRFQNPKGAGKHPWGLPALITVQQGRAGRSMAAHLCAVHLDH